MNESLNPYVGYYRMSNGYMTGLLEELDKMNVPYEYDPYRNFLKIENDDAGSVSRVIIKSGGDGPVFGGILFNDPNDCVLLKVKTPLVVPPGAML